MQPEQRLYIYARTGRESPRELHNRSGGSTESAPSDGRKTIIGHSVILFVCLFTNADRECGGCAVRVRRTRLRVL